MMTKLLNEVSNIVEKEYDRASAQHGSTFNSIHEGYAVIKEEFDECHDELTLSEFFIDLYWKAVKNNNTEAQHDNLVRLYNKSMLAACEAIQTAAMIKKAMETMKIKNTQEGF